MKSILLILALATCTVCIYDILSFGAVPNADHLQAQSANTKAIIAAIKKANSSDGERIVRIPNKKFYSMPIRIEYVHNISIEITGKLLASQSIAHWPRLPEM